MKKLCLTLVLFAVTLGSVAATTANARGDEEHGIVVTFQKHLVDPANFVFQGTTGGAAKGTLVSRLVPGSLDASTPVWRFGFEWDVTAKSPHKSFVAVTYGTFDTTTGAVIMDGSVVRGWHRGSPVHEEGQLIDPATFTFAGKIVILPDEDDD